MEEVGAVSQGDLIPAERCQRCFRQWLHTRTAGRAHEDDAQGSVLFPSPSSSRRFPSSHLECRCSEQTASILGQAARAWLSGLRLSIALWKGNTWAD